MSVSKRGNVYRARVYLPDGKQRSKTCQLKSAAKQWEADQMAALATGSFVDPKAGRATFTNYYQDWANRQVWESTTVKAMNLAAGSVPFANLPLGRIRRSNIEQWVKAMVVADLAAGTIKTRFNNVRSVFRAAVRDRLIPHDPSEGVAIPRQRRREAAMRLPTHEQVGALLQAADPSFKTFIALAAFAGLRLGEAAAIQVGDIDFLRKKLAVVRQVQRANQGSVELRPPKCGSERTVFLAPELVELLASHIARNGVEPEPTSWIFRGDGEDPPHQNTIGHRWRRTLKRAGVSGVRLHDLRHYFASGLIAAGCDVVTVQRALGHARATTTLDTYSHLWPSAEDRTRDAAASLMLESAGQYRATAGTTSL